MNIYFPAEWHNQQFVQMTWPHMHTDWAPVIDEAIDCFCNIARGIARHEQLLIASQYPDETLEHLAKRGIESDNIIVAQCLTNDTWARDHAFLSCLDKDSGTIVLKDFQFNGWGLKFAANHDNMINTNVLDIIKDLYAGTTCLYENCLDFVFEGGSVESDGEGTLMVTSSCLLSPNRNNTVDQKGIEQRLKNEFNAKRVLWVNHSWLAGDDTDGHIDTVARFCSASSIAYVKCYDTCDEHYDELEAMEAELQAFRTADGQPYKLFPLPLPDPCFDEEGNRLPATYANFLIINGAVLMPTYNQPQNDEEAANQLAKAFPGYEIIGVDCCVLIKQHGSLHCSTMQYPSAEHQDRR